MNRRIFALWLLASVAALGFTGSACLAQASTASLPQSQNSTVGGGSEQAGSMHRMMHGSDGTGGMMGMCPMMQGGMGTGIMIVMMVLMSAFWIAAISALFALTVFLLRKSRQLTPAH